MATRQWILSLLGTGTRGAGVPAFTRTSEEGNLRQAACPRHLAGQVVCSPSPGPRRLWPTPELQPQERLAQRPHLCVAFRCKETLPRPGAGPRLHIHGAGPPLLPPGDSDGADTGWGVLDDAMAGWAGPGQAGRVCGAEPRSCALQEHQGGSRGVQRLPGQMNVANWNGRGEGEADRVQGSGWK